MYVALGRHLNVYKLKPFLRNFFKIKFRIHAAGTKLFTCYNIEETVFMQLCPLCVAQTKVFAHAQAYKSKLNQGSGNNYLRISQSFHLDDRFWGKKKLRVTICSDTTFTKILTDLTHIIASGRRLEESVARHSHVELHKGWMLSLCINTEKWPIVNASWNNKIVHVFNNIFPQ